LPCSKYSYSATLTVSGTSAVGIVGAITGLAAQCPGITNQTYSISAVSNAKPTPPVMPQLSFTLVLQ